MDNYKFDRYSKASRLLATLLFVSAGAFALAGPDTEASAVLQSAADVLRETAGADAAFLPAGMTLPNPSSDNLATVLRYPTDELAVVNLKGAQIRAALERSVALYPYANDGFLQLSNIDATFSKSAPVDSRVTAASLGGAKLDDSRTYAVAMPATLARGGLGYFKVWDRKAIKSIIEGVTLESILKGRRGLGTSPRWRAAG